MASDLNALVPATVTVAFRKAVGGNLTSDRYAIAVTLASLAIPEYTGAVGHEGVKLFRDHAVAWFANVEAATPQNLAALTALTRQIATDWYGWQRASADVVLVAPVPWDKDAFCDHVEWIHTGGEDNPKIATRVRRPVWNDRTEELLHATAQPVSSGSGSGSSSGSGSGSGPSGPVLTLTQQICVDGSIETTTYRITFPPGTTVEVVEES